MNNHIDFSSALVNIAQAQVKAILSGGDDFQEKLESLIQKHLKYRPRDSILAIAADHELLKQYTHNRKPTVPGMYLKLLHGRSMADEVLDDWGPDGPWIGPLQWFHCTYLSDIGIRFAGGGKNWFHKVTTLRCRHQSIFIKK